MPILSITWIPLAETVSVTCRLSDGTQYRLRWMFGFQRRLVRRWECETEFPKLGVVPSTWQRADMDETIDNENRYHNSDRSLPAGMSTTTPGLRLVIMRT